MRSKYSMMKMSFVVILPQSEVTAAPRRTSVIDLRAVTIKPGQPDFHLNALPRMHSLAPTVGASI